MEYQKQSCIDESTGEPSACIHRRSRYRASGITSAAEPLPSGSRHGKIFTRSGRYVAFADCTSNLWCVTRNLVVSNNANHRPLFYLNRDAIQLIFANEGATRCMSTNCASQWGVRSILSLALPQLPRLTRKSVDN